jgi:rare lipoprotein A
MKTQDYDKVGQASWYGPKFHRRMTSNGEWFDQDYLSAAHPTLPLPSYARVTNLENGRQLVVRVNDRGPFVADRIIDLSKKSADVLGFRNRGPPGCGSSISDRRRSTTRAPTLRP